MKVHRIEVFQRGINDDLQWYWHARAHNGRILADSGEGYRRRADCVRAMEAVVDATRRGIKVKVIE